MPSSKSCHAFSSSTRAIGSALLATMFFFSSLTFSALNQAMAVIFDHRDVAGQRSSLRSLLLPYAFVALLGVGLLAVTLISITVQNGNVYMEVAWYKQNFGTTPPSRVP